MEALRKHKLKMRPGKVLTDVIDLKISAEEEGWPGVFTKLKDEYRRNFNMHEYEREDLKWYNNALIHHFAYVFGREVYDYDTNKVDIDRLLDQGNEFGGYDVIILWHQYPRLGVDQRNQFDFFDDFPGGREGIKEVVDKAHLRGTMIFLPFKPWDVTEEESTNIVAENVASLVRDTDIDGFFLDTMDSMPENFRKCVDEVKPGVVFCSEVHPFDKSILEVLTSSWDQYFSWDPVPESALLRFILPEHITPVISRWHVDSLKDSLIKRAIFNGTGVVVWQDVFGSWLPYSSEQKALIKKWKALWNEHKHIFMSKNSIPQYPTLVEGLHCNMFYSDCAEEIIYVLFNENDDDVSGSLFINSNPQLTKVIECWNSLPVSVKILDKGTEIQGTLERKQISIIKVFK